MKIQKKSDFIKWNLLKNKTKKVEYDTPRFFHVFMFYIFSSQLI